MDIDKGKVITLIKHYSTEKGYSEKSWLTAFCEDKQLNYKQWHTLLKTDKGIGIKVIDLLVDVFPNLNLNWLLKDDGEMFITGEKANIEAVNTSSSTFENEVIKRLELIQVDIQYLKSKGN